MEPGVKERRWNQELRREKGTRSKDEEMKPGVKERR